LLGVVWPIEHALIAAAAPVDRLVFAEPARRAAQGVFEFARFTSLGVLVAVLIEFIEQRRAAALAAGVLDVQQGGRR